MPGRLILCGAPIGNPGDASPRLAELLRSADVIAAEDTRRVRRLAAALGIGTGELPPVISYFEHNELTRSAELVRRIQEGQTVALITDAGMPAVSDPGYRVVAAAAAEGLPITALPGPSAVTTALALSGLPTDRWVFEGFLPRKQGERRTLLAALAQERRTLVLLESPHRLAASLRDLAEAFGADRPAAVARELSKTYEEVVRDQLGALADWAAAREVKGEITLVVAGETAGPAAWTDDALVERVRAREAAGLTRKAAIAAVVAETGQPRRRVYDLMVAARTLS